jgi:hypothetical protein
MLKLERIDLDDMTEEDMENIKLALKTDPGGNPETLYKKMSSGKAVPWRYSTPIGNTIFIIEENEDKKEKYLYVWYMGGTGIVGSTQYFIDAIAEYGKLRGCKSIRSASTPLIAKYMKRFDFVPQLVQMRKEI